MTGARGLIAKADVPACDVSVLADFEAKWSLKTEENIELCVSELSYLLQAG